MRKNSQKWGIFYTQLKRIASIDAMNNELLARRKLPLSNRKNTASTWMTGDMGHCLHLLHSLAVLTGKASSAGELAGKLDCFIKIKGRH
jgi:hypothetical protein